MLGLYPAIKTERVTAANLAAGGIYSDSRDSETRFVVIIEDQFLKVHCLQLQGLLA